jgi:hypothetical protein
MNRCNPPQRSRDWEEHESPDKIVGLIFLPRLGECRRVRPDLFTDESVFRFSKPRRGLIV